MQFPHEIQSERITKGEHVEEFTSVYNTIRLSLFYDNLNPSQKCTNLL